MDADPTPLPTVMKVRIGIVAGSSVLLFVTGLFLFLLLLGSDRQQSPTPYLFCGVLGLGFPLVCGSLMAWQVRRYRTNPEVRRRQPNQRAATTLLTGMLATIVVAQFLPALLGWNGWLHYVASGIVVLVGAVLTLAVARRQDPRVHWWRRPAPMSDAELEADRVAQRPPW